MKTEVAASPKARKGFRVMFSNQKPQTVLSRLRRLLL